MITWYHPDPKLGVVDWSHDAFIRAHCSMCRTGPQLFNYCQLKPEDRYEYDALVSGGPIDACEFIPAGRTYAVRMDTLGAYPVADAIGRI